MVLETGTAKPVWRRQYPIPKAAQPAVNQQVQKWIDNGKVVPAPAGCSWNNPLLAVPKKDSDGYKTKVRVCLDSRPINQLLPDDKFPMPLISEIFARLGGKRYFSTLDLEEAYLQLPIRRDHQLKTTFTWADRQWMFAGAPFGLKPISSVLQRLMTVLLSSCLHVNVFQDDITIATASSDPHHHISVTTAVIKDSYASEP